MQCYMSPVVQGMIARKRKHDVLKAAICPQLEEHTGIELVDMEAVCIRFPLCAGLVAGGDGADWSLGSRRHAASLG